ncbi:MAG: phosphoribulokinase [Pseudonocardia sp.]|nr:phosphoribulokinase [Pseudonocardia sp.]
MPEETLPTRRAGRDGASRRPVMLAIAGDSAAGKTTLTRGLVEALGPGRCVSLCTDDYHRYDRAERAELPITALHPDGNYLGIMEQHLQLLATGAPVLKPVYDHSTGTLTRPELVEPAELVIVEGLLPLHSRLSRACFDITVYLDPPEKIRREWKIARDTGERGYTVDTVLGDLERREPDAEAHIRPQRRNADLVLRFAPIDGHDDPEGTPLSATVMMRPTIDHPDLTDVLAPGPSRAMHLGIDRDSDGRAADSLHVHGYVEREESMAVQKSIWTALGTPGSDPPGSDPPDCLGRLEGRRGADERSEPLAIAQLVLLHYLMERAR